jgi:hypothetical protein
LDQPTMPSSGAKHGPSGLALWANMAVIYVVWGSTYFGIAVAIETMPPFLMAAIRFATCRRAAGRVGPRPAPGVAPNADAPAGDRFGHRGRAPSGDR